MTNNQFPPGWDEERVRRILAHYELQSDEEAAAEDEAAFKGKERAVVEVPMELVPVIRELIGQYQVKVKT
jgi:hypothetical protein